MTGDVVILDQIFLASGTVHYHEYMGPDRSETVQRLVLARTADEAVEKFIKAFDHDDPYGESRVVWASEVEVHQAIR